MPQPLPLPSWMLRRRDFLDFKKMHGYTDGIHASDGGSSALQKPAVRRQAAIASNLVGQH
jgi:hypothetical protein